LQIREVHCKSILNKSGIPGIDYALNPYTGCEHGCSYCYAVFMKRFSNHKEAWGDFVDVKINAAEVLARQLKRSTPGIVSLSTVTDPYQPLEKKYRITRSCIETMIDSDFSPSILTKSPLVVRDIELLQGSPEIEVGFSIAFLDVAIRRKFEPKSPPVQERIKAARKLSDAGIRTWFFLAPVFPHFSDTTENLASLLAHADDAGVAYILFDTLQLYAKPWMNIRRIISQDFPTVYPEYQDYLKHKLSYREELKKKVLRIAGKYSVRCEFTW
jgi:DNA repair photolyase